jgi:HK97 gp10 family phage protein
MIAKNVAQLRKNLHKRMDFVQNNVLKVLNSSALLVEGSAKESIQRGIKSGKTYTRGGVVHQASAEGEAPATDTGFLVSNITHQFAKKGKTMASKVLSKANYSEFLEFGTRNMGARPFLQPALEKNRAAIKQKFIKENLLKK